MCRRLAKFLVKSSCSTGEGLGILVGWREAEESGISGGGVKSNDPRENTKGEGSFLGFFTVNRALLWFMT